MSQSLEVNDIVIVTGSKSIMERYIRRFGIITGFVGEKAIVMFEASLNGVGSESHTSLPDDLLKVGPCNVKIDLK